MGWRREGYCCRCGECCKGDPYETNNSERSELMRRKPSVAGCCPLFEVRGGQGACVGYGVDPYYLAGCNVWPESPNEITDKPSCTYRFTWQD